MSGIVMGCPAGTYEYNHRALSNTGNPIGNASCEVTMNNGQTYTNNTNTQGWVSFCVNSSSSINQTECSNPSLYTATISNISCPNWAYLNGKASMSFRLTNNVGEALEAQDCYVKVYNERGFLVHDLGTNLLYDNQTFLDANGNYVRTAGVPLTSSVGTYGIVWHTSKYDQFGYRLYRENQTYTVVAECNGKIANCTFDVYNKEPIHIDETVQWAEENAQVLIFGIVTLLVLWYFIIPALRKGGGFGSD
jgi:hypothetical protein